MGHCRDDEYSVIGDEGGVSFEDFQDFQDDIALHETNPVCIGSITVSTPFPFSHGKPQSSLVGKTAADSIAITNTTEVPVELWSVRIFSSNPKDCYLLSLMRPPQDNSDDEAKRTFVGSTVLDDRVLQPGEMLTIWLSCKPEEIGMHTAVIHFVIGDDKIEKVAFLLVDDDISLALGSSKPFIRTQRKKKFDLDPYVPASRPPRSRKQEFRYGYVLPLFEIPRNVRKLIESGKIPGTLTGGLSYQNYSTYFSTLLFIEEIHMEEEMRGYDMELVTMRRKGKYLLALEVPGLAERRPSLVYGDIIFVKPSSDGQPANAHPFQGYIYKVEANEVCLRFADEFHHRHQDGNLYTVSFAYNRVNMRRLYQALEAAEELGTDLLFPSRSTNRRVFKPKKPVVPLNENLNSEQLHCVQKIIECRGAPPYVIHGPPGTGKTMTLVEAILQVCTSNTNARILVCASSNSAADHVLEKLIAKEGVGIEDSEIFRLNAPSRPYDDLKVDYIQFCFFRDMVFTCPPLKALLRYKIIVSTYMSASHLYAEGIHRGHFTHIFMDEAGQASEPETMIPIANLSDRETVVVLAGDHLQLGPVIFSKVAEYHGLGQSYLQRLFNYDIYKNEDKNFVTKLIRNYRCHPAILKLPSELFYKGELIASKEGSDFPVYKLVGITKNQFPVLFVGIQGCDEREGSNPSWFNRVEVSKVIDLIRKLRNMDFNESDIGVITPYRQQVLKLRKALESHEMEDVKVGSVEQFQGQEREIIIISTVRSTVKHNEFDRDHNLGFLSNPRRFNVSITRARSLLVIVGNPHILTKDPFWDRLLRHCADNNSYQGCLLPEPEVYYRDDEIAAASGEGNPTENVGDDLPAYTNNVPWDQLPSEYPNEVPWNEELPNEYTNEFGYVENQLNAFRNKAALDEEPTSQCSNEVGWGKEYPREWTDEVAWDEELPGEGANEGGWSQLPTEHKKDIKPTVLSRHFRDDECMELALLNIEELECEDHLMQYPGHSEWNEALIIRNINNDECDMNFPVQCADEDGWDEDISEAQIGDVKWTKITPGQCNIETESDKFISSLHADKVKWNEDDQNKDFMQLCQEGTQKNEVFLKQFTRVISKVDQYHPKQQFDEDEQNEDTVDTHCRDAGWNVSNREQWSNSTSWHKKYNEQRSKRCSEESELQNFSWTIKPIRNKTGFSRHSNTGQWNQVMLKKQSNRAEWQVASSSDGEAKAVRQETEWQAYDTSFSSNKFKRYKQRLKRSSHGHAWRKISSGASEPKGSAKEVEDSGPSFRLNNEKRLQCP